VYGIKPRSESFTIRVFVGLDSPDHTTKTCGNPHYVNDIYMYGFGASLDKKGRFIEGTEAYEEHLVDAPAFNVILDLKSLYQLYDPLPTQLKFSFVPVSTKENFPLADECFAFDHLTISSR